MVFVNEYASIQESIKTEYKPPKEERFRQRKFKNIRWQNKEKERNFSTIIKILAEKGPCTIREIVENDGISDKTRDQKYRADSYRVAINGNEKNRSHGLVEKRLVKQAGFVKTSKSTPTYELTIFGIFVAIDLFSENNFPCSHVTKYDDTSAEKPILEYISENYKHHIPIIFEKWGFLKQEIKSLANALIEISQHPHSFGSDVSSFYNTRPLTLHGWKSSNGIYQDEIIMLFYNYVLQQLPPKKFIQFISKDKEIFEWYKKYIFSLSKSNKEERLRIEHTKSLLKGDLKKGKIKFKEINAIQGIELPHLEEKFD